MHIFKAIIIIYNLDNNNIMAIVCFFFETNHSFLTLF